MLIRMQVDTVFNYGNYCDDGLYCTEHETCDGDGVCGSGIPRCCGIGTMHGDCATATCNEELDACVVRLLAPCCCYTRRSDDVLSAISIPHRLTGRCPDRVQLHTWIRFFTYDHQNLNPIHLCRSRTTLEAAMMGMPAHPPTTAAQTHTSAGSVKVSKSHALAAQPATHTLASVNLIALAGRSVSRRCVCHHRSFHQSTLASTTRIVRSQTARCATPVATARVRSPSRVFCYHFLCV